MREHNARVRDNLALNVDKLAEGGQFGTKDGHIGRDFRVGT